MRARGKARIIDFVLSSLPIEVLSHSKALATLSDHEPILSSFVVKTQKLAKTRPDCKITNRVILESLQNSQFDPLVAWD